MRIGEIHFTGYEDCGVCWMCGGELPTRRRRWCSDKCRDQYWDTWNWGCASLACLIRDHYTCQSCGRKDDDHAYSEKPFRLEVHHKVPINGEDRSWHRLNAPEYLTTLCHICHLLAQAQLRLEARGVKQVTTLVVDKRQGVLL